MKNTPISVSWTANPISTVGAVTVHYHPATATSGPYVILTHLSSKVKLAVEPSLSREEFLSILELFNMALFPMR